MSSYQQQQQEQQQYHQDASYFFNVNERTVDSFENQPEQTQQNSINGVSTNQPMRGYPQGQNYQYHPNSMNNKISATNTSYANTITTTDINSAYAAYYAAIGAVNPITTSTTSPNYSKNNANNSNNVVAQVYYPSQVTSAASATTTSKSIATTVSNHIFMTTKPIAAGTDSVGPATIPSTNIPNNNTNMIYNNTSDNNRYSHQHESFPVQSNCSNTAGVSMSHENSNFSTSSNYSQQPQNPNTSSETQVYSSSPNKKKTSMTSNQNQQRASSPFRILPKNGESCQQQQVLPSIPASTASASEAHDWNLQPTTFNNSVTTDNNFQQPISLNTNSPYTTAGDMYNQQNIYTTQSYIPTTTKVPMGINGICPPSAPPGQTNDYGLHANHTQIYQQQHTPPPSQMKTGHAIAIFGFGKLITMFPTKHTKVVMTPEGQKMVEKMYPGSISVHLTKNVLDPAFVSQIQTFSGPLLSSNPKSKKKDVLKMTESLLLEVQKDNRYPPSLKSSLVLMLKLLTLLIESDGVLGNDDESQKKMYSALASNTDDKFNGNDENQTVLDRFQKFLEVGDKKGACKFAVSQKLWAHALVLASHIDKDTYFDVVHNFSEDAFSAKTSSGTEPELDCRKERSHLKILYSILGGNGQVGLENYFQIAKSEDIVNEWLNIFKLILFNRTAGDSNVLQLLSERLLERSMIIPSQLVQVQGFGPSFLGGLDSTTTKVVLLGANHRTRSSFYRNHFAIQFTELFEYSQALSSSGISGLPHLQAYKLIYAGLLADMGMLDVAFRYCESIESYLKGYTKGSPYFHYAFVEAFKALYEKTAVSHAASGKSVQGSTKSSGNGGSWFSGDGLMNVLDKGFSKLISNAVGLEGEEPSENNPLSIKPIKPIEIKADTTPSPKFGSYSQAPMSPIKTLPTQTQNLVEATLMSHTNSLAGNNGIFFVTETTTSFGTVPIFSSEPKSVPSQSYPQQQQDQYQPNGWVPHGTTSNQETSSIFGTTNYQHGDGQENQSPQATFMTHEYSQQQDSQDSNAPEQQQQYNGYEQQYGNGFYDQSHGTVDNMNYQTQEDNAEKEDSATQGCYNQQSWDNSQVYQNKLVDSSDFNEIDQQQTNQLDYSKQQNTNVDNQGYMNTNADNSYQNYYQEQDQSANLADTPSGIGYNNNYYPYDGSLGHQTQYNYDQQQQQQQYYGDLNEQQQENRGSSSKETTDPSSFIVNGSVYNHEYNMNNHLDRSQLYDQQHQQKTQEGPQEVFNKRYGMSENQQNVTSLTEHEQKDLYNYPNQSYDYSQQQQQQDLSYGNYNYPGEQQSQDQIITNVHDPQYDQPSHQNMQQQQRFIDHQDTVYGSDQQAIDGSNLGNDVMINEYQQLHQENWTTHQYGTSPSTFSPNRVEHLQQQRPQQNACFQKTLPSRLNEQHQSSYSGKNSSQQASPQLQSYPNSESSTAMLPQVQQPQPPPVSNLNKLGQKLHPNNAQDLSPSGQQILSSKQTSTLPTPPSSSINTKNQPAPSAPVLNLAAVPPPPQNIYKLPQQPTKPVPNPQAPVNQQQQIKPAQGPPPQNTFVAPATVSAPIQAVPEDHVKKQPSSNKDVSQHHKPSSSAVPPPSSQQLPKSKENKPSVLPMDIQGMRKLPQVMKNQQPVQPKQGMAPPRESRGSDSPVMTKFKPQKPHIPSNQEPPATHANLRRVPSSNINVPSTDHSTSESRKSPPNTGQSQIQGPPPSMSSKDLYAKPYPSTNSPLKNTNRPALPRSPLSRRSPPGSRGGRVAGGQPSSREQHLPSNRPPSTDPYQKRAGVSSRGGRGGHHNSKAPSEAYSRPRIVDPRNMGRRPLPPQVPPQAPRYHQEAKQYGGQEEQPSMPDYDILVPKTYDDNDDAFPSQKMADFYQPFSEPPQFGYGFSEPPRASTAPLESTHKNTSQQNGTDDLDDLGLGNTSLKKSKSSSEIDTSNHQEEQNTMSNGKGAKEKTEDEKPKQETSNDQQKGGSSGSNWFTLSWFKKKEEKPDNGLGPVRANLGEESSFYFDPETKRWVNKKSGAAVAEKKDVPPPPTDLGSLSAPATPELTKLHGKQTNADCTPGMSRANKRGARNKYVDVMNRDSTTNSTSSVSSFLPPPTIGLGQGQPKIMKPSGLSQPQNYDPESSSEEYIQRNDSQSVSHEHDPSSKVRQGTIPMNPKPKDVSASMELTGRHSSVNQGGTRMENAGKSNTPPLNSNRINQQRQVVNNYRPLGTDGNRQHAQSGPLYTKSQSQRDRPPM